MFDVDEETGNLTVVSLGFQTSSHTDVTAWGPKMICLPLVYMYNYNYNYNRNTNTNIEYTLSYYQPKNTYCVCIPDTKGDTCIGFI